MSTDQTTEPTTPDPSHPAWSPLGGPCICPAHAAENRKDLLTDPTTTRTAAEARDALDARLGDISERVDRGIGEGMLGATRWRDALIEVGTMLDDLINEEQEAAVYDLPLSAAEAGGVSVEALVEAAERVRAPAQHHVPARARAVVGVPRVPGGGVSAAAEAIAMAPGPYSDEDGETWWVPIVQVPNWMKAAAEVRSCVDTSDVVVSFDGKETGVALDMEHEGGCLGGLDEGDPDPPCIVRADCWRFILDLR